jgi:phosphoribosylformylglycinamidine synthase
VAVPPEHRAAFERLFEGMPWARIGAAVDGDTLSVSLPHGALRLGVADLKAAWRGDLPADARCDRLPVDAVSPAAHSERRHSTRTGPARVLILHATGTNRDHDAALACRLAGAEPEIVHVNQLLGGERRLLDYHMLIVPGGFSYGDDLGAGVLWALDVGHHLSADVTRFITEGRPVLGICNGFQALVKAGLLPGPDWRGAERPVTLTYNESARFECRWVVLRPDPHSPCLFTEGIESIYCPVAHGEGRLMARDEATLKALQTDGLAALTYVGESYPLNPNGSVEGIAGLCNRAGNVLGLMPHPENHVFPWQSMAYGGQPRTSGLRLFQNGIKYA